MTTYSLTSPSLQRIRPVKVFLLIVVFFSIKNIFIALISPLPFIPFIIDVLDVILVYSFLLYWLGKRLSQRWAWRVTPLDGWFLLLGCSITLSTLLNDAFSSNAIKNVFVLLRYIAVYYLAANVSISPSERAQLRSLIIQLGQFLSVCAIVLYFLPSLNDAVDTFLRPTQSVIKKLGSVRLTFSTQAEFAAFLVIALTLYLFAHIEDKHIEKRSLRRKFLTLIRTLIFLCAIFTAYKRAFFITSLGMLVLFWLQRETDSRDRKMKILILTGCSMLVALTILFFPFWKTISASPLRPRLEEAPVTLFYTQLLSKDYWLRTSSASRGWSLLQFVPRFFASPYWLLGAGPDENLMRSTLASVHPELQRLLTYQGFEDVYWVAILAYYGVTGLSIIWSILGTLFFLTKRVVNHAQNEQERQDGKAFRIIALVFFLLSFTERLPELASTSFVFWLYAGLVVKSFLRIRYQDKTQ